MIRRTKTRNFLGKIANDCGEQRRFDDFQAIHIAQTDNNIHWAAQLLPWHRYYMSLWQTSLTEECGYKDAIP